jgi:MFS family permease
MAAVLQTGVNCGVGLAALAYLVLAATPPRYVFLVGVLPALMVLWIRRAVPETEEWRAAKGKAWHAEPGIVELFRGDVRRITVLTLLVCSLALTAHWAFVFWFPQQLRTLADVSGWDETDKNRLVGIGTWVVIIASVEGNFIAAWLARLLHYRRAIAILCLAYCVAMVGTYCVARDLLSLGLGLVLIGTCQGVFALFTMYMPPLFPTLLRTTGAGFCYNIGRIAAGLGVVIFGLFSTVGDSRLALFYAGFLFLPAAGIALLLPEPPDERSPVVPLE